MARPRVFISSTFYDLRHVREDLDRFINGMGYESVRHEVGEIPYGSESHLEEYAYREVELCDIVVCIVGGRYGSPSASHEGSITQNELKRALEKGIQVFIFVEQNVLSELSTFLINKDNKDVKYRFVDNVKVYEFLEQIHALPRNNPIAPFSTSADICTYLRAQWAGLFQRFLQEQKWLSEIKVLGEMRAVAGTLEQLVGFLTAERRNKDEAIESILLMNHPAFRAFAKATGTPYRVFFTDQSELKEWLKARNWTPVAKRNWDEDSVAEWQNERARKYLKLTHNIFLDDGRLKPLTDAEWKESWVQVNEYPRQEPPDDDISF